MRGTPVARSTRKRSIVAVAVAVACLSAVFWSLSMAVAPASSRVCVGAMNTTACVPPA